MVSWNSSKVNGKIVQFDVVEYKPDSAMGINCWSGKHLNFISQNEVDAKKGDIIVGRITEEPSKVLGSWKIPYEPLVIGGEKVEADTNKDPDNNNETTESTTVVMSADANSYIGKNPQEVANELKGLGFENVKLVESVTTDTSKTDGVVESVTVAAGFSKGDSFKKC